MKRIATAFVVASVTGCWSSHGAEDTAAALAPVTKQAAGAVAPVAVLTQHNDNARTGANTQETALTTSNVNGSSFGWLFDRVVDGDVYAQPLILPGVTIRGTTYDVLYVVTEHDTVYAFDADNAANSAPLWYVSLGTSASPSTLIGRYDGDQRETGITSTPVIDPATGTIYVVAFDYGAPPTKPSTWKLHALDLASGAEKLACPDASGAEKLPCPATITASVAGNTYESVNGVITFNPTMQLQRPGLLLQGGQIYIGFGMYADAGPAHGWF